MSALKVWVAAKHEGDQLVLAHLYLGPELVLWPRWRWASSFFSWSLISAGSVS